MSRRERKSKGALSILDEFTSATGAGEITYTPSASAEVLQIIEQATKLADVPITLREYSIAKEELKRTDNKKAAELSVKPNSTQNQSKHSTVNLQTDNKQVTNGQHTQAVEIKTGNKQVTKRITEQITIGKQTGNKQVTNR